jgi:hypothetical protein
MPRQATVDLIDFEVKAGGIYRITYDDLKTAGLAKNSESTCGNLFYENSDDGAAEAVRFCRPER